MIGTAVAAFLLLTYLQICTIQGGYAIEKSYNVLAIVVARLHAGNNLTSRPDLVSGGIL